MMAVIGAFLNRMRLQFPEADARGRLSHFSFAKADMLWTNFGDSPRTHLAHYHC